MRNRRFGSKTTTEILVFCSRCLIILLFSLFPCFERARQERSISKRSKNENVTISHDRVQIHLPKTTKRGPPDTRFLRQKHRCSKRLQNGIVKISWGFPSKSPHGFAKNGLARVPANAPARARPTRPPEVPHIENVTISLYRVQIHLPKKLKRGLPGGSWEVDFESFLIPKKEGDYRRPTKTCFSRKPVFFDVF